MFPQPKKIWPTVVTVVAVVFAFKNPAQAADLVNQAIAAAETFLSSLG